MATLRKILIKKAYPSSEIDLYDVLTFGLDSFDEYQALFEAVSTKHNALWSGTQRTAIEAARAMPDRGVRGAMHEILRDQLKPVAIDCCVKWKMLEVYINAAFPAGERRAQLVLAGKEHYTKASRYDWGKVEELLEMASNYIDGNTAILEAAGMPLSFQDNFSTAQINYTTKYNHYKRVEQDTEVIRDAKIQANNDVFNNVNEMFKVGQKIFRDDPNTRKLFTFSKILEHARQQRKLNVEAVIKMKTDQKTSKPGINFGVKLVNGKTITNDWGDNTAKDFTGNGTSVDFYDKTYVKSKTYSITTKGAVSDIIELHLNNSNLTYLKLHKAMKKLEKLISQGNKYPTKVVDDILITINANQTSIPDSLINLLDSDSPSEAGLQAKVELESRGWVVLVSNA